MPRNSHPLTNDQVARCHMFWEFLCQTAGEHLDPFCIKEWDPPVLDTCDCSRPGSRTMFVEDGSNVVKLGCDALPGGGGDANSRLSLLACLAHELAHAQRYHLGFRRPFRGRERHLDEAETNLHAAFNPSLNNGDIRDLVEDAEQRLSHWRTDG